VLIVLQTLARAPTQEFYDRSFEQWCDNKQYGKAYATSSGPQRNNYDWVPGPDLAAIVVRTDRAAARRDCSPGVLTLETRCSL
jgi:hypothetical protein